MADENVEQTDENSQNASAASSSAEGQVSTDTPPTGEQPGSSAPENRIPQKRFNEVVQERNRERETRELYEQRIRDLESRQSVQVPQRESVIDVQAKRLAAKLGMDESAAREILESSAAIHQAERAKVEQRQSQFRAEEWARNKAKDDSDYAAIEPELDRAFSALGEQQKHVVATDPNMLEMFYESVRSKHLGNKAKEAYSKGAEEAYKAKQVKQAVSSVSGGSANNGKSKLTLEDIQSGAVSRMSDKEYRERQSEINALLERKR